MARRDWRLGHSWSGSVHCGGPDHGCSERGGDWCRRWRDRRRVNRVGIPELEAKRYEGKVKAGNLLISVHTENSEEISRAKEIFTNAGAQDICTTGEASTPKGTRATDLGPEPVKASAQDSDNEGRGNLRRAA